jgi:hypothetical protein
VSLLARALQILDLSFFIPKLLEKFCWRFDVHEGESVVVIVRSNEVMFVVSFMIVAIGEEKVASVPG